MNINEIVIATRYATTNDRNGNPRRVWVFTVVSAGLGESWDASISSVRQTHTVFVFNEGFQSLRDAIVAYGEAGGFRSVVDGGTFTVTPAEYKRLSGWKLDPELAGT